MPRKIRKDTKVGSLEKILGIPVGSFRNKDGRKTRSDKTLGALRKEAAKINKKK